MNPTVNNASLLNSKSLLICLFILFAGLSTGAFFTFLIPSEDKLALADFLQSALESGNLKAVPLLLCNFIWLALIFVSGITVYGFPFSILLLFIRSMALGTCIPLAFISPSSDHFILFIFNLFFTLILLAAVIFCINYAMPLLRSRASPADSRSEYLTVFAVLAAVTAITSVLEALIL